MKGQTWAFRTWQTKAGWYCRKEKSKAGFARGFLVCDGESAYSSMSLGLVDEQPLYGSNAMVMDKQLLQQ
jgi:hypothetical protein